MAFFQDNRPPREPFLNAPPTVLWLIGLLLATHAARVFLPGSLSEDVLVEYALTPARYAAAFAQGIPPEGALGSYVILHYLHVPAANLTRPASTAYGCWFWADRWRAGWDR